jgi:hypothetical protein
MLSPASSLSSPSRTVSAPESAGWALSICSDEISSRVPPPTWNEASEMPKKSMMRSPASALTAITTKALNAATRAVRWRCARFRLCVK